MYLTSRSLCVATHEFPLELTHHWSSNCCISSPLLRRILSPLICCMASPASSPAPSATPPEVTWWMNVVVSLKESRESVLVRESLREWVRSLWGVSERCYNGREGEKGLNYNDEGIIIDKISLSLKWGSLNCKYISTHVLCQTRLGLHHCLFDPLPQQRSICSHISA